MAFGEEQATRLLWRAGFGPAPGQAAELAKLGLHGAVRSLTRPASKRLVGPNPVVDGGPLAPRDAWGHDHLWWLDRMVRTQAPLVERMTLVWHDWFATSKAGVPQKLMLRQNALLRRHALGNFEKLALDVTKDPAMLLWLNGTSNSRWDVNENYARELQELFCLGAGRGYSERDVRQLARALTGFRNDWTDAGPTRFRFDKKFHDRGAEAHLRPPRQVRLAGGGAAGHPPSPPPRVHGHEAVGLLHPHEAVGQDDEEARAAVRRQGPRRPPAAGGDPRATRTSTTRPSGWSSRRSCRPPGCCAPSAAGSTRPPGRGCATAPASTCSCRRTSPAGTTRRWLDTATFRARWQMAQHICEPARLDGAKGDTSPSDPAELVDRAVAFWGSPKLSGPVRAGLERYAADTLAAADKPWKASSYPVLALERAADARRHLPGLPDELMKNTCCTEHARASAGLPAIEAGMPEPAGTGLSRRSFLLRSAGLGLAVYGAGRIAQLPAFEAGVAHAQAAPAGHRAAERVPGRRRRLAEPAGAGRGPDLPRACGRSSRSATGRAFAEDPRLAWHPAASALADLHAEGKVSVLPAVGYTDADQSHFTSRHFWEVGALDPHLRTGWLGRVLDRVGTPDNPLQGISLDGQLAPSLATARNPVAAVDKPEDVGFWTPGAWGPAEELAVPAFTGIGRSLLGSRRSRRRARPRGRRRSPAASATRSRRWASTASPPTSPAAAYPQDKDPFPQRLAGFAAMLAAGLPIRAAAIRAPGAWDTHANQADVLPKNLKLTFDSLLAFQRDIEARGLADRVLTLVWSEFGRRAAENGSGTDHGAAGVGFLVGTRAAGRMIGEFPGLGKLDKDGNLRATSDFRGVYGALCGDWFGVDPAAVLPERAASGSR